MRAGEVVGLGRPARLRPDRDRQGHLRRAARSTAARSRSAGDAVSAGSPRAAIAAGIALLPEDRKAEGIIPTLSVRENIVLAALPPLSRAGFVSRAPAGRARRDASCAACGSRRRVPTSRSASCPAATSRRCCSPASLCLEPRGAAARRADPRHRRRRQGRDPGADRRARRGRASAVVLISSELEEVVEGADRVVVLRDGAVVGKLRGDEITEDGVLDLIAARARASVDGRRSRGRPPTELPMTGRRGRRCVAELAATASRPRPDPRLGRRARRLRGARCSCRLQPACSRRTSPTLDNLRLQLVQVAPVAIVALGMALVIGTRGHRPVRRLGHGDRRPRCWRCTSATAPGRRDRRRARRRRVRRRGQRRAVVALVGIQPIVATLAPARRRPRPRAGDRRRPADRDLRPDARAPSDRAGSWACRTSC